MSHYLATILTKLSQRYSVLYQHIGFIVCCSYVTLPCNHSNKVISEVQCTVSAYRVYRLLFVCQFCLHIVFLSCCIVYRCVLLFSFSRCRRHSVCQCLLLGRFFSVRLCSSTCIWGIVLILLRFCPHVYFEALSSYFILRPRPHCFILRLCPHLLYWGFVLIFYFEVLSSCLFWGFVLIFYIEASSSLFYIEASSSLFYIEASSSYFILRLCPHVLYWGFVLIVLYWGYVPQFEALVLIVVGPCYFLCTAYLICLQWYVCGSVCLYFCLG